MREQVLCRVYGNGMSRTVSTILVTREAAAASRDCICSNRVPSSPANVEKENRILGGMHSLTRSGELLNT